MADEIRSKLDAAKRERAQVVFIELTDGRKGAFVGPALLAEGEMAPGAGIGVKSLKFGRPHDLLPGSFFATLQNGEVVLMRETDEPRESN